MAKIKKSMLIWSRNVNDNPIVSLWVLDDNGVPSCEIETEWATTKIGCLWKLFKDCRWRGNLRYFFGICKVRQNGLNEKEQAILKSYNYATGSPFQ